MKGALAAPFICFVLTLEESNSCFDKTRQRFGRRRRVEDPRIAAYFVRRPKDQVSVSHQPVETAAKRGHRPTNTHSRVSTLTEILDSDENIDIELICTTRFAQAGGYRE